MGMKLTTDHDASRYGVPVFLDGWGNPMEYSRGIRRLRTMKRWNTARFGRACGVSGRTVEGWEQGRSPSVVALYHMMRMMDQMNGK